MSNPELERDATYRHRYMATDIWLDEAIWGHRIYDQPSPELILLELLNVIDSLQRQHKTPFRAGRTVDERINTSYRRSLALRTVLFNNATLRTPLEAGWDDDQAWTDQVTRLNKTWTSYGPHTGVAERVDFSYLKVRFPHYRAYVDLVETLRRGAVEYESNKRWTSKFLFPYCPQSLFEDLNDRKLNSDRRFFGRSGELAYLMLARSGFGDDIWNQLRSVIFDKAKHSARWQKAIESLAHDTDLKARDTNSDDQSLLGYLPYESHHAFRTFGGDVKTLLLAGMPEYDVIPYLARLITFHLLHYVLVVASEGLGETHPQGPLVTYVLEIQAGTADVTRRLARSSFQVNDELSYRRVLVALQRLREQPDIKEAIVHNDRPQLESILESQWWPAIKRKAKPVGSAEKLWMEFEEAVKKRHRQHLGRVHHEYSRLCGLASRAGTNAYRYAPTDAFLRTLVLANVPERMDYDEFLEVLYRRYGFVIAKPQAVDSKLPGDLTDFDLNNRRLQIRLTRLGLMHRLSDACAYVINRYREGS